MDDWNSVSASVTAFVVRLDIGGYLGPDGDSVGLLDAEHFYSREEAERAAKRRGYVIDVD